MVRLSFKVLIAEDFVFSPDDDLPDYSGRGLRDLCSAAVALIDSIVPLFIPTHSFLVNFTLDFVFNDKFLYFVLSPHI